MFEALLRGDVAERDRLVRLAENILRARERLEASGKDGDIIVGEPIRMPAAKP
jgi:hypothetical protein